MADSTSVSSNSSNSNHLFAGKAEAKTMKTSGFWQAYALGIGIALGGFSSQWPIGMQCGVWEGFSSLMVLFIGFLMLNLCLSEMCSAVAFAGGSYGYVRCSLGPFYGFLAACTEVVQYMFYTIYAVKKMAMVITHADLAPASFEPIWALIIYGSITSLHCIGGNYFWNVMIGLTLVTVSIILTYFFGSMTVVDFAANATGEHHHGAYEDLLCYSRNFEYFFLCYMGVCALPLTSSRIKDEVKVVPKSIIAGICTLFAFAIMLYFAQAAQPPDLYTTAHELFTFSYGFKNFAGIPLKYGCVFAFIPLYGSAFGFMFASKHQLNAMACSGMLPKLLAKRFGANRIPLYALFTTTSLQYVIYLIARTDDAFHFFPIIGLSACLMYTGIFSAFIIFRTRFENMHRNFVNPLGIAGAVLGILIFGYAVLTVVLLHGNYVWITMLVYLTLMVIFYYGYVESNQFFSKEEQEKFMKAYILNMNTRKKSNSGQSNSFGIFTAKLFHLMKSTIRSVFTGNTDSTADDTSKVSPKKTQSRNDMSSSNSPSKASQQLSTTSNAAGKHNNSPAHVLRNNKVDIAPDSNKEETSITMSTGRVADAEMPQKTNEKETEAEDHVQHPEHVSSVASIAVSTHTRGHHVSGNSSVASNKVELVWTGNVLDESHSRKVFQALVLRAEELDDPVPITASSQFPDFLRLQVDVEADEMESGTQPKETQLRPLSLVDPSIL